MLNIPFVSLEMCKMATRKIPITNYLVVLVRYFINLQSFSSKSF